MCATPERADDGKKEVLFIPLPALLWDGETKGRREYACAPERPCAVFLLARIRHGNRDRGCEPAQLAAVLCRAKAARELSRAASGMNCRRCSGSIHHLWQQRTKEPMVPRFYSCGLICSTSAARCGGI